MNRTTLYVANAKLKDIEALEARDNALTEFLEFREKYNISSINMRLMIGTSTMDNFTAQEVDDMITYITEQREDKLRDLENEFTKIG